MKKLLVLGLGLALLMGLGVGGAWADYIVFPNNTLVQSYSAGSPPAPYDHTNVPNSTYVKTDSSGHTWYDNIGSEFQTYGGYYDTTTEKLYLYTLFGGADKTEAAGSKTVKVADLFLNLSGTSNNFDTAVVLSGSDANTGAGTVYTNFTTVTTSIQAMTGAGSSWIIGGKYDYNDPKDVPVLAIGDTTQSIGVAWSYGTYSVAGLDLPSGNIWQVTIDLGDITGFDPNQFAFLWATGTCANDTAEGRVPLPGAVLLLGAGLVRLVGYGRRKRAKA